MLGSVIRLTFAVLTFVCVLLVGACAATNGGTVQQASPVGSACESSRESGQEGEQSSIRHALIAVSLPADLPATSVYVSESGARALRGHEAWVRLCYRSDRLWAGSIPVVGDRSRFVASLRVDGESVADTRWVDDHVIVRERAVVLASHDLKSWIDRGKAQWVSHLVEVDIGAHLREDLQLFRVTFEAPDHQLGSNFPSDAVTVRKGVWLSSVGRFVDPEFSDLDIETIRVFANLVYASADGSGDTMEDSTPMLDARIVATSWQLE